MLGPHNKPVLKSDKPHILVVVNVFRPDLGGGVLFSDLCDGLHERGFEVSVKCAYPYYPQWTDTSGENGLRIRTDIRNGYTVERHGIYIPSNPNSLFQRLIYEASFFLSLLRRLPRRGKYDAMIVFSPLMGAVAYAAMASKWSRIPCWLNIQDLSAQAAAAGGISGSSSALQAVQNFLFRRFSFWSTISPSMSELLSSVRGAPKSVEFIPNWLHRSLSRALVSAEHTLEVDRLVGERIFGPDASSPLKLFYSGNIGGKQNLLEWCKMLSGTKHSFQFRIHGAGARATQVSEWIEASGDPRFEMHELTDEAGLARHLHDADFFVITEQPGAGASFVPSKLIPGMTSATPILAVCDADGPMGQEVRSHDAGYVISWTDPAGLDQFFSLLQQSPESLATWSQNARKRSSFYERERGLDRCVEALETLTGRSFIEMKREPEGQVHHG